MKVLEVARERVLEPCSLDLFTLQIDPYEGCSHHCVYCYTQNRSAVAWQSEVGLIPRLKEMLEAELEPVPPQTLYMGMNTDPYQPLEEEMRQTRGVLEVLARRGFSVCLLTKSPLVLRDVDLIRSMPGSSVGFSVAFAHESVRKMFEPEAGDLPARVEALEQLRRHGIETYALIDPVVPHVSDLGALLDMLIPHVGAVWVYPLSMERRDAPNWLSTRSVIEKYLPDVLPDVERAAFDPEDAYWRRLGDELRDMAGRLPVPIEIHI